jgi:ABC-2 type transport system permease protein
MRLFRHQLKWEQRLFWRSRESAVFVFLFPILLFALLTAVYNGHIDGRPASWVLLAGMIGYGAANTAFAGLAITLVSRREIGILKRIRATPLPPAVYLTAVLVSIMIVFAIQVASLFALGLAITGFIRSLEGSSAVLNVIVLPMAFLTGSFGPTRHYPRVLRALGDVLPLKYVLDLIKGIYLHGQQFWDKPLAIAVLGGWGLFGMAVALRTFRWEPREG